MPSQPGPVLISFADIEAKEVEWLWPGRFPLAAVSLIAGRPGLGKSYLTTEMAAHVSAGTPWPDDAKCPQGEVIFMAAEDNPGSIIRPRLDAAGAELNRVHMLAAVRQTNGEEWMISLANIPAIETALQQKPDCKLLVVDPIGSYLGEGVDAHRDNEVRSVLAPLGRLAETYGVAVVLVAHNRKSAGIYADDTVMGSRAFTGLARAVWHLYAHPVFPHQKLLLAGKMNCGNPAPNLAFAIDGDPPKIEWEPDPVTITADDVLAMQTQPSKREPRGESQSKSEARRAGEWLRRTLADGARLRNELKDDWENGEGGSWATLKRAKLEDNEIVGRKKPGEKDGAWWWAIKGTQFPWEKELSPQERQNEPLEPLQENQLENSKELKELNSPPSTAV